MIKTVSKSKYSPSALASPSGRGHIVHIIDGLKVGGAQTHLVTMLREACAVYPGIEHRVVSLFGDGPTGDWLRDLGITVDIMDLRPHFARRRFFTAAREIEEILREQRPDLVEAHLTWSRLLGLFAAWRAGVSRRIGFEQGDIYLKSWKFRLANRIGQRFADRIIVCSHALADWNRRVNGFASQRMVVFHNCIDPDRFQPHEVPAAIASFERLPVETLFISVGTLGRGVNKRTDVSIKAIAAARARGADVGLVICGDGEQRSELETLTVSLGIGPYVKFLGTRDDVPGVLARCDAFCHAAPFEPFGIVCIEAMAVGIPVIVPNSGGIREAVDDGQTGLIYPALDHEALAAAMLRLHEQPEFRRKLGRAARQAAEQRFSSRNYIRRLYTMYGLVAD